jgi:hypothetical protein
VLAWSLYSTAGLDLIDPDLTKRALQTEVARGLRPLLQEVRLQRMSRK